MNIALLRNEAARIAILFGMPLFPLWWLLVKMGASGVLLELCLGMAYLTLFVAMMTQAEVAHE